MELITAPFAVIIAQPWVAGMIGAVLVLLTGLAAWRVWRAKVSATPPRSTNVG